MSARIRLIKFFYIESDSKHSRLKDRIFYHEINLCDSQKAINEWLWTDLVQWLMFGNYETRSRKMGTCHCVSPKQCCLIEHRFPLRTGWLPCLLCHSALGNNFKIQVHRSSYNSWVIPEPYHQGESCFNKIDI